MKNWLITIAVAVIYLLFSIFTGLWALSWIIWVFYAVYRIVDYVKSSSSIGSFYQYRGEIYVYLWYPRYWITVYDQRH